VFNRAVFLDRDDTMARDTGYCRRPEDFNLFENTPAAVRQLNEAGFKVIVITNQSGIGRGYFDEDTLGEIHDKMKEDLSKNKAIIDAIYYCPHRPDDGCDCRKPGTKLIRQAAREHNIDLGASFMVGDLQMDVDLGRAVGCRTVWIRGKNGIIGYDAAVGDILEAAQQILAWEGEAK